MTLLLTLACSATSDPTTTTAGDAPTWHQDVAPLVAANCASCHASDSLAFELSTYAQAFPMAQLMADRAAAGIMPPWHAIETDECTPPFPFQDDPRMSQQDVQTLLDWASAGAPEGDAATAAPLPVPPSLDLDEATLEVLGASYTVPPGDTDHFVCFTFDLGLTDDRWLTGVQLVPENHTVSHHALVFTDPTAAGAELGGVDGTWDCFNVNVPQANLVGAWVPGARPNRVPPDAGHLLEAGTRIVVQMHYHPTTTTTEVDVPLVRLALTEAQPRYDALTALIGNFSTEREGLLPGDGDSGGRAEFRIPANEREHVETLEWRNDYDGLSIFAVATHMHYVGIDMKIDVLHEDGTETCLLQTPWDFAWQRFYHYDAAVAELPRLVPGDVLRMRCTYDNSTENPYVREALLERGLSEPQDVFLGEETLDEMCLAGLGLVY